MTRLLEVEGLDVWIGGKPVCKQLALTIAAGQSWALLGRNGVGKTTLLHHLAGLLPSRSARIRLTGTDLAALTPRARARRIGLLLQHSDRGFGANVIETVLSGRHPHLSTLAWEDANDHAIAMRAIAELGLDTLTTRALDTLSGGELRRVELARLLTQAPPLCLLDEPTNHLDLARQASCLATLRRHCVGAERAMLMAVHDLNIAYHSCDHWLILLGDGHWRAGTREDLARADILSQTYGHPIVRIEQAIGPVFIPELGMLSGPTRG